VYHKDYDNLISASVTSHGVVFYSRHNDAEVRSSGMDLYVTYTGEQIYGWLSYGYLIAEERLINSPGGWFPRSTYNRTDT
jgi:hypothetical protein